MTQEELLQKFNQPDLTLDQYESTLSYFNQDELAADTWIRKYRQPGDESPDTMHRRMAKEFARVESNYISGELLNPNRKKSLSSYGQIRVELTENRIYNLFKDFKYVVPQGSIMATLGNKFIGSLSNCFVVGQPEDSYGSILKKDEELVHLMRRRGGVGIDISTLRPKGTAVSGAAKTSTGATSFMHRYSNTTREVAQDGRRGALMLSIDINHPDSLDFIKIKRDGTSVTGANISVKINNEFMKAVEKDEDYILRFPCNITADISEDADFDKLEYNKLEKWSNVYVKKIKAKEYWDEIIKSAHGYAEPGIIFENNHHDYSPDGVYDQYKGITTNPCGEIFMGAYDACRLIALNLYSFVENPFTDKAKFDFEKFYEVSYEAMRLSDNLIDLEAEHIDRIIKKIEQDPEDMSIKGRELEMWKVIKKTALSSRRTGLGFTALGDALAALNFKYDSDEAMTTVDKIMATKFRGSSDCTVDLAKLRGTFVGWDRNKEFEADSGHVIGGKNSFFSFIEKEYHDLAEEMYNHGRRNASWSTVAPTGTVSIMTQTTSGIEPLFMPFYTRRKKINPNDDGVRVDFTDELGDTWQEFPVLHPKFKDWVKSLYDNDNPLWWEAQDLDTNQLYQNIPVIPNSKEVLQKCFEKSPWFGSTANDIDWTKRVELQGIIQKYITHSISSTINLPNEVKEEEVARIYLDSWYKGLKGVTVYRDGSRSGVLVSDTVKNRDEFDYVDAVKRPKELEGELHITRVGGKPFNVFVGLLNSKPYEIFIEEGDKNPEKGTIRKAKRGSYLFERDGKEGFEILPNMTDEQSAITRLISTSLRHGADIKYIVEQLQKTDGDLFSFTKGLARVLKKYIPDGAKSTVTCMDCDSTNVIFEEGCNKCMDCGSSKCG